MKFHHSGGRKSTFKENPLRKIEAMKWSKCNPNLFSFSFFVSVVYAPYSARIKANCCSLTILLMNQNLEKAYDHLKWSFIWKRLEFFQIPPKLIFQLVLILCGMVRLYHLLLHLGGMSRRSFILILIYSMFGKIIQPSRRGGSR